MAAFTLISSTSAGPGASGGSTSPISTIGATLIVLSVTYNSAVTPTISDSQFNSWIGLTSRVNSGINVAHRFYYSVLPSTASNHTFSVTGGNTRPGIIVYAYYGVDLFNPFDVETGVLSGNSPLGTGSITPTTINSLILTALGSTGAITGVSVSGGFTQTNIAGVVNVTQPNSTGWLELATPVATSATWTWGTGSSGVVAIAAFKPAGSTSPAANTRISQDVIELLSKSPVNARVSQNVIELLSQVPVNMRTSQYVVELLSQNLSVSEISSISIDELGLFSR